MKKKSIRRILSVVSAAVLTVGAAAMFTGCTTDNPEITITYTFNGKDYKVDYKLSRKSAPKTVQHFIELADAGYYEGLCIHDYSESALYAGGYTYENGSLKEKNYFETVKSFDLTPSVFLMDENRTPLYTVYGEFSENGVNVTGSKLTHQAGALVMYYTEKGKDNTLVTTLRNDKGANNDGNAYQENSQYKYNSATSLFYTYTGSSSSALDKTYCVFGVASDYAGQMTGTDGLLTAIGEYIEDLPEGAEFTEEHTEANINQYDPFSSVRDGKIPQTFSVPVQPIVIKSVKVNKY